MLIGFFKLLLTLLGLGRPPGVDAQCYAILRLGRASRKPAYYRKTSVAAERAWILKASRIIKLLRDRLGHIGKQKELTVADLALPGIHGEIPLRLYSHTTPVELIVYFHGGGWTLGSLDTGDFICRILAERFQATVVSVGYHLAPESPFPAAVEDALTALEWALNRAPELGVEKDQVTLCGTSAGATIVASACLRAKSTGLALPARQLLIHPATDLASLDTNSYREYGNAKLGLSRAQMEWFIDQYVKSRIHRADGYVSPLRADDLKGLPPAMVVTAEFDVLRDEAESYAMAMRDAGVRTHLYRAPGMVHGFLHLTGIIPSVDRWTERFVDEYKEFRTT